MLKVFRETTVSFVIIEKRSPGTTSVSFFVVTVNDEHTNLGSKESIGVKFKEVICTKLCLKPWYFCNITISGWF